MPLQQHPKSNGTNTVLSLLSILGIGLAWFFRDSLVPTDSSSQRVLENAQAFVTDHVFMLSSSLTSLMTGTDLREMSVEDYIAFEYPIARAGVLANIGPNGKKVLGALPGVVVASPSTSEPDYFYTWTRDSALVYKMLVDQYIHYGEKNLKPYLDDFVASQKVLQHVSNPSGDFETDGLGEPKFHVNLTAFEEPWGRPQRDGPALRATTLIAYGNSLVDHNFDSSYIEKSLWPVIKADLDYVVKYWNMTGFDLWEEVSSSSFFTTAVQHRALREGAAFASRIKETSDVEKYNEQAENTLCFLQSYWNPDKQYVTSNTGGGRSGIDANSVLASIHTFDPAAGCDPVTFQPCSDKALSNLKIYVDSFRKIYEVNSGIPENAPVATGRYSEDIYYEGNPWYLTTFAVAEQLYDALIVWKTQGYIEITPLSLPFFRQLLPDITQGKYTNSSSTDTFTSIISAVKTFADGFIVVNARFTPRAGNLAEQFNRTTGVPVSARDLTWSYAAVVTTVRAREGFVPDSWGAEGLEVRGRDGGECKRNPGPEAEVEFEVRVGGDEKVYLTGSVEQLKNWNTDEAISLSRDDTLPNTWRVRVSVPADTTVQYKFIRKGSNKGGVIWEKDPNHQMTSPKEGGEMAVRDTWQG
ncbi:glycoside hydrolase family 15 protein [Dendrothele bispora CBS 962.96]|uniref:Glucoamylase n=1 Tax=Dendrothele bispora (strain CBS 962.96) TaxID=1314807 RepID=A0A4V4HHK3_DENBC|nr:glycoside hydrolase family 15 protein [Dendrothele bispora CBS 962.96]